MAGAAGPSEGRRAGELWPGVPAAGRGGRVRPAGSQSFWTAGSPLSAPVETTYRDTAWLYAEVLYMYMYMYVYMMKRLMNIFREL